MIDQTDESSLEQPSIVQEARVIWLVIFGYNCPRPAVPCESVAVSFPASKLIVRSSSVQKRRGLLTHSPHSLTHSHSLTHTHSLTHSLTQDQYQDHSLHSSPRGFGRTINLHVVEAGGVGRIARPAPGNEVADSYSFRNTQKAWEQRGSSG